MLARVMPNMAKAQNVGSLTRPQGLWSGKEWTNFVYRIK